MGEGLKQRLIGAVVLLALLIIIAPALFRGGETHPLVTSRSSPEAPKLESPPVPAFVDQLDIPQDVVEVVSSSAEIVLEPESVRADKATGIDEKGHLKAWSLQLATFADKANADNLERQLKNKGYSAFQKKIATEKGKVFYRVYIGPEVRPDELQQIKVTIRKAMGLEGILVRYVP
ncbi:SPOR domain-containing protein [Endozoicomonas sp. SESOKO1]|uniref:SPOR domain-containing protein n=1 Tax=Endozoicomonas sp. SESOKO1 TaxID=2828742 RepID=UPI0021474B31|nr:SPOR domain-containing protein [Endozoicomonas sp. SESOKO1]